MSMRFTGKSIIIETDYGRIIVFVDKSKHVRIRLQRRDEKGRWKFVKPSPRLLQIICSKHLKETRGKGNKATEGEMIIPAELEDGNIADNIEEVYNWIIEWIEECKTCNACWKVPWETNCDNMCYAEWEIAGIEFRPIPPQSPTDCYMEFTRESITHSENITCYCEPLRFE